MKNPIVLCWVLSGVLSASAEEDRTAWRWEAPFAVGQAGMIRLELPAPVLDVSRADLGDLRVMSPAGAETPYLVDVPVRRAGNVRDGLGFKVALEGRTTVIEVATGTSDAIEALQLVSPALEFLKSVRIEGRANGGEWRSLAANEVIFRQAGGPERLHVPLAAGVWEAFRFTVDDGRTRPVPFTGVRMVSATAAPVTVGSPVVIGAVAETAGGTRVTLDLGAGNLHVAELRFVITDAVFSRSCSLGFSIPTADGETRMETAATGVLYRVVGERGVSAEELVIPVHRRIPARYLVATFRNADSPPLKITGAEARCYPTVLAFHAAQAGAWKLLVGNREGKTPVYDLIPLRGALGEAGGLRVVPGMLREKDDYQVPAALPGVEPAGVDIGLADWSRRRTVKAAAAGVIRIELDARILAGSRSDLGDLRLVQEGRQIPFLVKPGTVLREIKPTTIPLPKDPKRPTVSRWEVTFSIDGLPLVDLTARSAAPLFARRFVALIQRKDELGNAWTENAGAVDWVKSGTGDVPMVLNLEGNRMPGSLVLETDHGDNPPISLDGVTGRFAAPSIAAKLTESAPLYLYYGNPKARFPQYDLRLVSAGMMAADQRVAELGDEEMLKPAAPGKRGVDAGSPWLWLALGGVVLVLLVIVARLLPRAESAQDGTQR